MVARRGLGLFAALAALAWCAGDSPAAFTYSFKNITANSVADATAGEAQLSVTVSDAGSGQVAFTFNNAGPAASSITDVYFDDGSLLGIASITNGPGVSFSQGASPGNLPGGEPIDFVSTAGFLADSDPPAQPNGVNPGEFVTVTFNLIAGQDLQDVIDALALGLANPGVDMVGGLRIGIHVQGFDGGGSEGFVNGPPQPGPNPVPAPPSVILAGIGVLGFGGWARLRRKFAKTA